MSCFNKPPKKEEIREFTAPLSAYEYAKTQLNINEYSHKERVGEYLECVDMKGWDTTSTAWCAAFVNWCFNQAGVRATDKPNARSFMHFGEEVSDPKEGDVVVFWRVSRDSWKGHVGFFSHFDENGDIVCLGGNQNNMVCYATYPKERLLSFRRYHAA